MRPFAIHLRVDWNKNIMFVLHVCVVACSSFCPPFLAALCALNPPDYFDNLASWLVYVSFWLAPTAPTVPFFEISVVQTMPGMVDKS